MTYLSVLITTCADCYRFISGEFNKKIRENAGIPQASFRLTLESATSKLLTNDEVTAMPDENVTFISQSRIVDAERLEDAEHPQRFEKKALNLFYFLKIIENMLEQGTEDEVTRDDLAGFITLAREKADSLCQSLAE